MISVQHINKAFGSQQVLKNISFRIPTGTITGFLGPNGAGKSTTMKIVTGYLQADAGSIFVNQQKVEPGSLHIRREIGYLPEHNPIYKEMYIKEYLRYVAGVYKLSNVEKRVKKVIEQTGLGPEQTKKIKTLSKGYRQRVGIAQAIIHEPSVLILDEPTSGLDPNQIVEVRNLILELGKEKTVMLSTHIMQEVEAMCQRVLILNNGQIAKDATVGVGGIASESRKYFKVVFDRTFDESLFMDNIDFVEKFTDGALLVSVPVEAEASVIFDVAVANGLKLLHMSEHIPTMEHMFRDVTSGK